MHRTIIDDDSNESRTGSVRTLRVRRTQRASPDSATEDRTVSETASTLTFE